MTTQADFSELTTTRTLAFENQKLFTKTQLDWLVKFRDDNGLTETGAVIKVSRKLYIHKPKFFAWFLTQKA